MNAFERPLRWGLLVLTDDDPATMDIDFWIDLIRRTRTEGLILSAGGYVAYYPTDIRHHYRSRTLGERDIFGKMTHACRDLGLTVVARTDPHAIHADAFDAHPEWAAMGPDGAPRRHESMKNTWRTCPHGPYHFDFMTENSTPKVSGPFVP